MVQCRAGAVGVGGLETAMRIGHDDADTLITYPRKGLRWTGTRALAVEVLIRVAARCLAW